VSHIEDLPIVRETFDGIQRLVEHARSLVEYAFTNDLTRLPNRAAFRTAAQAYDAGPQLQRAVAFIDLTGFKAINDQHSHGAGDAALRAVADKLKKLAADCNGVAYHLSGDEFLMLFPADDVDRFEAAFASDGAQLGIPWGNITVPVRSNAGVVLPEPDVTLEELQRRADVACRHAKDVGRPAVRWSPSLEGGDSVIERRWRCPACAGAVSLAVRRDRFKNIERLCPNCGGVLATSS
jgi:diguanylate cyclase